MKPEQPGARRTRTSVHDRIFRAGAALLAEGGTAAVTARSVCARAKVTAPTLYRHFGDLNGLYGELLTLMYVPEAKAHPGREFSDPVGMIEYMWDCCVGTAIRNPGLVDLKNQLLAAGTLPEAMRQFYARLEASFETLGRRGVLKHPPKIAAAMYWAAAVGIARMIATARHGGPACSVLAAETLRETITAAVMREAPMPAETSGREAPPRSARV